MHIDELYAAFAPNRPGQPIGHCSHCVGDDEAHVLQHTALRDLSAADLARYTRKAMGTWGEESDFRYFLPRILELFATGEQPDTDLFRITMRNVRHHQPSWPVAEREAVDRFLVSLWRNALPEREPPLPPYVLIEGCAENDHTVVPYLEIWAGQTAEPAMVHLAVFVDDLLLSSAKGESLWREAGAWIGTGVPGRKLAAALAATTDPDAAGWFRQALDILAMAHPR